MIEEAVKFLLGSEHPINVIDIWCWSGVLGLSLYKLAKDKVSNLILADISEEALDLAKENKNLIVGDAENIYFYKSDLLLDSWICFSQACFCSGWINFSTSLWSGANTA